MSVHRFSERDSPGQQWDRQFYQRCFSMGKPFFNNVLNGNFFKWRQYEKKKCCTVFCGSQRQRKAENTRNAEQMYVLFIEIGSDCAVSRTFSAKSDCERVFCGVCKAHSTENYTTRFHIMYYFMFDFQMYAHIASGRGGVSGPPVCQIDTF